MPDLELKKSRDSPPFFSAIVMQRLLILVLLLAIPVAKPWLAIAEEPSPIGRAVDNIRLKDVTGQWRLISDLTSDRFIVLAFLGTECPLARLYAPRLVALNDEFAARGVAMLGIVPNQQDTATDVAAFAAEYQIDFPMLMDEGHQLANLVGAQRTPEVFVLDEDRVVRYRGRIDDQYGVGYQRPAVNRRDLAAALEELLAGQAVSIESTDAPGCLIGREMQGNADGDVTWSNQISRIFQKHCQACHREGEIGPFPLTTYDETLGWGPMIREVVEQGRMPPWHANPQYGRFSNDARLSDSEKDLVYRWIAAGMPKGDPDVLPPPREFSSGWDIEPDGVYYIRDEPFAVPAEGIVDYQWFTVDPGFTEDVWVRAVQCRPGSLEVVHHAVVYYLPPGEDFDLRLGDKIEFLGAFVPGIRSFVAPEGIAFHLPAGSKLVFEMHYTPNGVPHADRTCVGLEFADPKEVRRELNCVIVANVDFEIPPGDPNYRVDADYTFTEDALLIMMRPHMHLRGKSFRYVAEFPGGNREILLDVPRYDFNWQHNYFLEEPRYMPRGTRLHCIAHFDNSTQSPVNPDPADTVRWGNQTTDEMMIGGIFWTPVAERSSGIEPPEHSDALLWVGITGGGAVFALGLVALVLRRPRRSAHDVTVRADGSGTNSTHANEADETNVANNGQTRGKTLFWRALCAVLAACLVPILVVLDTAVAAAVGWPAMTQPLAIAAAAASGLVVLIGLIALVLRPVRRTLAQNAKKWAVFGVAVLTGWLLAEAGLRAFVPTARFHVRKPNTVYDFNPDPLKLPGVSGPSQYTTNSFGLRGEEWTSADDSLHLLCVGGGSVEGLYLDDDKTWTNVLGDKLTEGGSTPVKVAAAAVSEFASGHHLRFIETSPVVPPADCVVVQLGAVDLVRLLIGRDMGENRPPLWYGTHTAALLREFWNARLGNGPVVDKTGERFVGGIRRSFKIDTPAEPPDFDQALDEFAERIRAIVEAARRRGVERLVFTTQPVLWTVDAPFESSRMFWVARIVPTPRNWEFPVAKNLRPLMDRYNQTLRATCAELGVECIDLDAMNGQRRFFYDDYHVNDAGAEEMARQVADYFSEHPLAP